MRGQIVTVFGGSGFIGRHLMRRLARAGARVRVAVRHPETAHFLRPMGDVGQIQLFKVNVTDEDAVAKVLEGASAAINLAGVLYQSGGGQKFDPIHAMAPGTIGEAAARAGVARIVHVSAIGADAASPSHYARSKAHGEDALTRAFADATILRPSVVFGPEDGFFNKFAALARYTPALPLYGGGNTRFQPVYVGDVADAIVNALASDAARGKIYELGGPQIFTFRELMELILKETGRKRLLVPLPFFVGTLNAAILGLLPNPLVTMDQIKLLKSDNVVADGAPGLKDLCVTPSALELYLSDYLVRFRRTGQFARA
ncbi:MAG TPA: complex I NDUFA9 subunit family protein [Micropepsaceae bacterium]|nr:complex I NDUFA9 subunit family protein [Micropepsaceae bacterium]